MPQPYPAGTIFDPATGLAVPHGPASSFSGGPNVHPVVDRDAGPGKELVYSASACGPGERQVCCCRNCGGPNDLPAVRCGWCGVDFTATFADTSRAPAR